MSNQKKCSYFDLPTNLGEYRTGSSASKMTWFGVGGAIDILFKPRDALALSDFIKKTSLNFDIIGVGSNLIVRDNGIDDIVIKLSKGFNYISCDGDEITVGGAVLLSNLALFASCNAISGLEFFINIPGTVGGALEMNAGAYGSDTASVLKNAKLINSAGEIYNLNSNEIGYLYRGHRLQEKCIFVEATFAGVHSNTVAIQNTMRKFIEMRNNSQPTKGKTGGSTFKNPANQKAWQLIKESSCANLSIGGAKVAEKHCNFLLNYNNATAADLENLGNEIRKRVFQRTGVKLEWEIRFLGK